MKIILFLVFVVVVVAEDQTKAQIQNQTKVIQDETKSDQIENVELNLTPKIEKTDLKNTVKLKKNSNKVKERQLREEKKMQKMRKLFLKDIDKMIKNFNLDRELDENKLDTYFKDLEDELFQNMKNNFLENKEYTEMYDNLVQEYNNIKSAYD